jgi:hypothetical protein
MYWHHTPEDQATSSANNTLQKTGQATLDASQQRLA